MMVIAPTARSPPYLERLEVKLMERILSVESMTKVEIPSARQGRIMSLRNRKFSFRRWRMVFFQVRKRRIHTAPTA